MSQNTKSFKLDINFLLCDSEPHPVTSPATSTEAGYNDVHGSPESPTRKMKSFRCEECSRLFSEKGNLNKFVIPCLNRVPR
jgi:hypothetical protein